MKRGNKQSLWLLVAVLLVAVLALQLMALPSKVHHFFQNRRSTAPEQEIKGKEPTASTVAVVPYHPLQSEKDLDVLLKEIGDAPVVMLGEASHGTSEYYTWRATITRRLILEKGFRIIAVEGDWPESAQVNRYIKGKEYTDKQPEQVLKAFDRWPTWMWANHEIASLVGWLRQYNQTVPPGQEVGFYGLDLYSLCKSLMEVSAFLEKRDGKALPAAERAITCYRSFNGEPDQYALGVLNSSENCKNEFQQMLETLRAELPNNLPLTEVEFDAEQNALVAVNAEQYYRVSVRSDNESWNVRDRHMMQTLQRLLKYHGAGAKAVVWEHNTHIGDARATDMVEAGMVNLGQLAREQLGAEKVFAVGFGSYKGTVIAATAWDSPMKEMKVPEAKPGSWEHRLHKAGEGNKLLLSRELRKAGSVFRPLGHRAIGVVYDPSAESRYNYVPSQITKRYDAFLFIDKTQALHPLEIPIDSTFPPSLYPWVF